MIKVQKVVVEIIILYIHVKYYEAISKYITVILNLHCLIFLNVL